MADKTKIIVGCTLAGALLIGGGLGIGLGVVKPMKDKDKKIAQYETQLTEQNKELESYKRLELDVNLLEELKVQVATNKTTIGALESDNAQLSAKLAEKEATIAAKLDIIAEHEAAIRNKDGDIAYHLAEIDRLKAENAATLAQNASMQQSLNNNTQTINTLNTQNNALNVQILSLNQQIVNLMVEFQKANNLAVVLNNKVLTLQGVIDYYEQFISTLETSEQAVVTFKLPNGSIHNLQIVNKGSYITVADPVVENATFNYWKLDGEQVNPAEIAINGNMTFIADLTYSHTIKFFNGTKEHDSQQVAEGGTITAPEAPTKANYIFMGWSLDGVNIVVDLTQVEVTGDLNFIAIFERAYRTFVAKAWNSPTKISAYNIWHDNAGNSYYNETVNGYSLKLNEETDTWEAIVFNGVRNFEGCDIFNTKTSTYLFHEEKLYKLNEETNTWEFLCEDADAKYTSNVWVDGDIVYYSYLTIHKVLNETTKQWETKVWNGLASFSGADIWHAKEKTFAFASGGFMAPSIAYELNKETSTFVEITWEGITIGAAYNVLSDENFIYYIYSNWGALSYFKLDAETLTAVEITFNGFNPSIATAFWKHGEHFYYSDGDAQYELV